MSSQDSSATYNQLDSPRLEYIRAELNNWERVVFQSTIMDGSHKRGERSPDSAHTSTSVNPGAATDNHEGIYPPGPSQLFHGTAPPHVPPETYTYLIHALLSMQGAAPPPSVPSQSVPYPQGLFPGPSTPSVAPHALHQATHPHTPPMPSSGPLSHFTSTNTPATAPQHSASFHADAPSEAGDSADEATIVAEDKRRRNTSASARFRIKKKQKTLNLERTVADLTGRSEELEREASDLRRENSWLKEIVLLKGGRLGAFGGSQSSSSQQPSGPKEGPSSDTIGDGHITHE